jgi:tRNA pseudouridine55 synthase
VVRRARRALGIRKIGHLGTLDPMATGLLPLCLLEATKLVPYLMPESKVYRARVRLGVATDTQDATGKWCPLEALLPGGLSGRRGGGGGWPRSRCTPPLHFQGAGLPGPPGGSDFPSRTVTIYD